ncbi:MAG TPA: hypothetical protein VH325_00725 [Bryobacteraceae bacterium]|jgi:hypothetical protein|nr:hypothetical protein [Bryobacteraceae bacterium]
MSDHWTLEVLLDANWETVEFPSREAAVMTVGSLIDDYWDRIEMAHLITPGSDLVVVNLNEFRSRRVPPGHAAPQSLDSEPRSLA